MTEMGDETKRLDSLIQEVADLKIQLAAIAKQLPDEDPSIVIGKLICTLLFIGIFVWLLIETWP